MEELMAKTAPLYNDLTGRPHHILTAGMTGSGKSVIMNGMINSILCNTPDREQVILIDPKRGMEFGKYKNVEHCMGFAKTPEQTVVLLRKAVELMETRCDIAEDRGETFYTGSKVHIFVDEIADLLLQSKESATLLQRLCQMGRAANIQVICATQCPTRDVIPTRIKVNFAVKIGLHTVCEQDSRNILGIKDCYYLPEYGKAYIMYPTVGIVKSSIPMIPEDQLKMLAEFRQKA